MISQRTRFILQYLRMKELHATIFLSPTSLSLIDVIIVLITLFVKSICQVIGLSPTISTFANSNGIIELPDLQLTMPFVLVDGDAEKYFNAVGEEQEFLTTYAEDKNLAFQGARLNLFLSALTEPTMLLILAHRKLPIQPLGAVNVQNKISLLRPDLVSVPKLFEPGTMWLVRAALKKEARWVKRGLECDFVISLSRHTESGSITVFEQVFTVLQFVKHSNEDTTVTQQQQTTEGQSSEIFNSQIHFESDSPMKWSRICKDYNPIHVSNLLAKVFGFPGKLAHGNLVLARAIEIAIRHRKTDSEVSWLSRLSDAKKIEIEVAFKRPIVVPITADIEFSFRESLEAQKVLDIHVLRKGKIYMQASVK